MSKEQALLRELARVRSLKRALEKENKKLKEELRTMKLEELKEMIWVVLPGKNKASCFLTGLIDNPPNAWDNLVIELAQINKALAKEVSENGINYTILWNDTTCATRWYEHGLQIDTEEWYLESPKMRKIWESINDNNSQHADLIRDAITNFEANLIGETIEKLEQIGVTDEQLDALSESEETD